eukprot:4953625-Karenia_brevis.AAC.1
MSVKSKPVASGAKKEESFPSETTYRYVLDAKAGEFLRSDSSGAAPKKAALNTGTFGTCVA